MFVKVCKAFVYLFVSRVKIGAGVHLHSFIRSIRVLL